MSVRTYLAVLGVAVGVFLLRPESQPIVEAGPEITGEAPVAEGQDQTTTLDDQSELAITVYNSDIALIRDVRTLQLARGAANLRFFPVTFYTSHGAYPRLTVAVNMTVNATPYLRTGESNPITMVAGAHDHYTVEKSLGEPNSYQLNDLMRFSPAARCWKVPGT